MPDPSSFMTGNAPQGASYAAPLVGFLAGDRIAKLPEEMRAAQLRNAFPNGLQEFTDPKTGQLYPNAINNISDRLLRIGGADLVKEVLPLIQQQQLMSSLPPIGGQGQPAANTQPLPPGGQPVGSQAGIQQPDVASPAPPSAPSRSQNNAVAPTDPQPLPASSSASGPANITGDFPRQQTSQRQAQAQPMQIPRSGTLPAGAAPIGQTGQQAPAGAPAASGTGAAGVPFRQYTV